MQQTYQSFEVILINDGSTDETRTLILEYKKNKDHNNLIKVVDKENTGLTDSLNVGIRMAKGKYIARQDVDDISLPERFQLCVDFMDSNPSTDVVVTKFVRFSDEGEIDERPRMQLNCDARQLKFKHLKFGNLICHGTFFVRNNKTLNYIYDTNFIRSQDYELLLRFLKRNANITLLNVVTYKLRVHENSISVRYKGDKFNYGLKALSVNDYTTSYFIQNRTIFSYVFLSALKWCQLR
jgi:glycosyltransferase involved in cell wall biosynthesis